MSKTRTNLLRKKTVVGRGGATLYCLIASLVSRIDLCALKNQQSIQSMALTLPTFSLTLLVASISSVTNGNFLVQLPTYPNPKY